MSSKNGFIYLYKKALSLNYSSPLFGFFTRCLLLANHSKGKEPGVVNISTRELSNIAHLSRPTIITYLKELKNDGTIKLLSTGTRRTKFYFINYVQYQTQRQTGQNEIPVQGQTGQNEIPVIQTGKNEIPVIQTGQNEIPVIQTGQNEIPVQGQTGQNEIPVQLGDKNQKNAQNLTKMQTGKNEIPKLVKTRYQTGKNEIPNWSKRDTSAKAKSKLGSNSKLSNISKSRGDFSTFEENLFNILLTCKAIKGGDAYKLPELIKDYPCVNYGLEFKKFVEWWPGPKKRRKPWAVLRNWLERSQKEVIKPELKDSGFYKPL